MSKTVTKTVSSLYDEYMKRLSDQRESLDKVNNAITDCASRIATIEDEIDRNIHNLTPEEYSFRIDELNKVKREQELNIKKLSVLEDSTIKGFDSEEQKIEFIAQLRTLYKAEEDTFDEECLVHLRALNKLLNDRMTEANKALTLASYLNEYSIRYCSDIRTAVYQVIETLNIHGRNILE